MTVPAPPPEAIKMAHERPGAPVASAMFAVTQVSETERVVDRVPAVAIIIAAVDPTTGATFHTWAGLGIGNAIAFANEILNLADEAHG